MSTKTDPFCTAIQTALNDGTFVKVSLGHYTGGDATLKNLIARCIVIKRVDKISLTWRHKTKDIVKNHDIAEGLRIIRDNLHSGFNAATLFTTAFDLPLETMKKTAPTTRDLPSTDHDRAKTRAIAAEGKAYLHALGITDAKGEVLKSAQDKYRQINRYIELLTPLLRDLPTKAPVIADMGAGKGYLTFALYDYLTTTLALQPRMTGVEFRGDLVTLCNTIAGDSGFGGLNFAEGSIAAYDAAGTDMLIALHACDTATDDAIAKGIKAGAAIIVVAPCCHKQIRREMEQSSQSANDFLLRHGIFLERQAEMVTDGLRALILEHYGYDTKVFEFISDAHTPKNVMITAVKNPKTAMHSAPTLMAIKDAKSKFGIKRHALEDLLKI